MPNISISSYTLPLTSVTIRVPVGHFKNTIIIAAQYFNKHIHWNLKNSWIMSNLNFFLRDGFKDKVILCYPDLVIAWSDLVPCYSSTQQLGLLFFEMCFFNPSKYTSLKLKNFLRSWLNVLKPPKDGTKIKHSLVSLPNNVV